MQPIILLEEIMENIQEDLSNIPRVLGTGLLGGLYAAYMLGTGHQLTPIDYALTFTFAFPISDLLFEGMLPSLARVGNGALKRLEEYGNKYIKTPIRLVATGLAAVAAGVVAYYANSKGIDAAWIPAVSASVGTYLGVLGTYFAIGTIGAAIGEIGTDLLEPIMSGIEYFAGLGKKLGHSARTAKIQKYD